MKGKHIFPVPWKTGVHYSQKRLNEFKEIKQEMKLPSVINAKKAETKAVEEKKLVLPPTVASPQPPSTSIKDMLPVLKYKNPERERLRTEQETKREKGRVKEIIFLKAKNLKKIKYPDKHKQLNQKGFNIPIIHPRNNSIIWSMEGEKKSGMSEAVAEVPKEIIKKPSFKDKVRDFVYSDHYTSTAKAVIAGISILSLLVAFLVGSFLFFAFFAPYYMVGYETTITVPINKTINETIPIIQPSIPVTPQPNIQPTQPPANVINVVLPPSQIIPVTIPPSVVPPNPTTTPPPPTPAQTSKVNTYGISFFGIPSSLEYLTDYQCYWDLRNKGFGKEFNPEYECNAQGTGLWSEACSCCHIINPKAC